MSTVLREAGHGRRCAAAACTAVVATLAAAAVQSQPVLTGDEHLAGDRPEAWAMKTLGAATLLTAFGPVAAIAPGRFRFAADLGSIPHFSDTQRRVGFDGTKLEDLNKSPVFGRLRVALGLPGGWVVEGGWTPSVTIDGARPQELLALAVGARVFESGPWSLSARVFGQHGYVRGDITCPADLAGVADPAANPYACEAPSDDRLSVHHHGVDAILGWTAGLWTAHAGVALVRTEYAVQVDALTHGVRDRTRLHARQWMHAFTVGERFALDTHWSLAAELLFVPLSVRRTTGAPRERDAMTSLRLQAACAFD